ncbi:MAG TPA: hypothetical protein VIT92_09955 [Burkholderiaceae bacterium]
MRNGVRLGSQVHVAIAPRGITVWRADGLLRKRYTQVADIALAPGTSTESLQLQLSVLLQDTGCAALPASFVIDDAMARLFMVTPPANAASLADCHAAAQLRLLQLYGDTAGSHALRCDWRRNEAFLACALPQTLIAALEQTARGPILQIAPHFVRSWNQHRGKLKAKAWFAVATQDMLTLAPLAQGQLHAVRALPLPPGAWHQTDWLVRQVHMEALRLDLPVPDLLQICGPLPGHDAILHIGALQCIRLASPGLPATASGLHLAGVAA